MVTVQTPACPLAQLSFFEFYSRVVDVSAVELLFWRELGLLRRRYKSMYLYKLIIKSRRELKQMACQGLLMRLSITPIFLSFILGKQDKRLRSRLSANRVFKASYRKLE